MGDFEWPPGHKEKAAYDRDKLLDVLLQSNRDACEGLNISPRDVDPEARLISRFRRGLNFDDFANEAYRWL